MIMIFMFEFVYWKSLIINDVLVLDRILSWSYFDAKYLLRHVLITELQLSRLGVYRYNTKL